MHLEQQKCQQARGDVRFGRSPSNPDKNDARRISDTDTNPNKNVFDAEKENDGDSLKYVCGQVSGL